MPEVQDAPDAWTPPPLLASPTLRAERGPPGRHATWLELFYDIVFVAAVGSVAGGLADVTPANVLRFVLLFYPVWWAWVGHTMFATRFDTDDVPERLLTLGVMVGAAGMAVQMPLATDRGLQGFVEGTAGFALAYVVARAFLLLLYLRVHVLVPDARPVTRLYLGGFGAGAALWLVSVFVHPYIRIALWVIALVVELLVTSAGRPTLHRVPVDASHLPERFGLFTLIVLGESVLAIVTGVSSVEWHPRSVTTALLVFAVVASIWWLYYTFLRTAPVAGSLGSGQAYTFAHLPLLLALAALGEGLLHLIVTVASGEGHPEAIWLTGGALAVWLLAFLGVQRVAIRREPEEPPVRAYVGAAAAVGALALLGPHIGAFGLLGGATLVFVALAILQVRQWVTIGGP